MGLAGGFLSRAKVREATLEATITRADGRVERLGTIAYWHKNPLRRWAWALRHSRCVIACLAACRQNNPWRKSP